MRIDGHTRLTAVLAQPIKHSISPFIHNRGFELTGVNGVYVAWDVPESEVAESLKNVLRYDMFGLNISMPYKETVISYLDDLTDLARLSGAVNTVINRNGQLLGHNTDGRGFFRSLEVQADFASQGKIMTILGGGGAATAILAQASFQGIDKVYLFNRQSSLARVEAKAARMAQETSLAIEVYPLEDVGALQEKILVSDLLVNATSLGMDGQSLPLPKSIDFPDQLLVADLIYQPFETPLLQLARERGLKALNGLGMLLFQAAEAFEIWTGQALPTDEIWQELEHLYKK